MHQTSIKTLKKDLFAKIIIAVFALEKLTVSARFWHEEKDHQSSIYCPFVPLRKGKRFLLVGNSSIKFFLEL